MSIPRIAAAVVITVLLAGAATAQSAADLLQKGIHAQETVGDLDGAIQIFRQVVASPNTNKQLAAQAQYQLVLCLLQKGDRPGAEKELQLLEKNFADQPDLLERARKLIPGNNSLLPAPWLDGELEQFNIKRDGASTGETITYSADPWPKTVNERDRLHPRDSSYPNSVYLRWELTTTKSKRSIQVRVDRDTLRPLDTRQPDMESNDLLGDTSATSLLGPALDPEESVFTIRRLPLAVGYKTTIPVTSGIPLASPMELSVTAIETVQVPAGKFNCYKVSFAKAGQTLWIGVDGAKPLVKLEAGDVDAELVKVWGPTNPLDSALEFIKAAGWFVNDVTLGPGPVAKAAIVSEPDNSHGMVYGSSATLRRIYTPASEIDRSLQQSVSEAINSSYWGVTGYNVVRSIHPGSLQRRLINGQKAAIFLVDIDSEVGHDGVIENVHSTDYCAIIQTENNLVEFRARFSNVPLFRWLFDPILATAKIP
jgi:hypothetical protein